MERRKKIGTDNDQDRCFTRLIINDELNRLLLKVRHHDKNSLLKDFIKPIKMQLYATVSRRIMYTLCVIFVGVCILKTGCFDKYISWNLRKISISLLSKFDWAKLRNKRCFLSNPSKFTREFKQEDCEQCENINNLNSINVTHFSDAMRLVKQDFPVVVTDSWSKQSKPFENVSDFVDLFLSVDDLGIYEPCGFASNMKRKAEDHHQLLQLVASGEVTSFYAHWENCAELAFKSFRRFYERPEFLPANIQLTDSNWVILCSGYQGKTQKQIDISSPLYIMMVMRGDVTITISPRKICNTTCTVIAETLKEGMVLLLTNTLWQLKYTPTCKDSETIVIGINGYFD